MLCYEVSAGKAKFIKVNFISVLLTRPSYCAPKTRSASSGPRATSSLENRDTPSREPLSHRPGLKATSKEDAASESGPSWFTTALASVGSRFDAVLSQALASCTATVPETGQRGFCNLT